MYSLIIPFQSAFLFCYFQHFSFYPHLILLPFFPASFLNGVFTFGLFFLFVSAYLSPSNYFVCSSSSKIAILTGYTPSTNAECAFTLGGAYFRMYLNVSMNMNSMTTTANAPKVSTMTPYMFIPKKKEIKKVNRFGRGSRISPAT